MTIAETRALIAEYEARLEELGPLEGIRARRPRTLDDAIERTLLLGERLALERLLAAQRAALEVIRERERKTKAKEACEA